MILESVDQWPPCYCYCIWQLNTLFTYTGLLNYWQWKCYYVISKNYSSNETIDIILHHFPCLHNLQLWRLLQIAVQCYCTYIQQKKTIFSFLIKYFGYLVLVTNCLYSVLILCKGFEGILLQSKKWGHSSKRRKVCLTYFVYSIVNVVVLN